VRVEHVWKPKTMSTVEDSSDETVSDKVDNLNKSRQAVSKKFS